MYGRRYKKQKAKEFRERDRVKAMVKQHLMNKYGVDENGNSLATLKQCTCSFCSWVFVMPMGMLDYQCPRCETWLKGGM